jgi:hypothetical protein
MRLRNILQEGVEHASSGTDGARLVGTQGSDPNGMNSSTRPGCEVANIDKYITYKVVHFRNHAIHC